MYKFHAAAILFATATVFASGCCCLDQVYCPSNCTNGLGPVSDSCGSCNAGGGSCSNGGTCSSGGCNNPSLQNHLSCCKGCGEIYWGEWISDPPDDCDPCDCHGNWVGPRCCSPRWWEQLSCGAPGLWGWRCSSDTCGSGESGCCSGGIDQFPSEEVIESGISPQKSGVPHQATPPKTGPTEAKPENPQPATPTQSAPKTQATKTHQHRHPPARLLQPARSTPTPLRPTPNGRSRT